MKTPLLVSTFLLFTLIVQSQDSTVLRFAKSIKIESIKPHLETLADDRYEGRESGKQGQKMAAKYISNHFQKIGLKPFNIKDGNFLQPFYFAYENDDIIAEQSTIYPLRRKKINRKDYYYDNDFEVFNQKVELIWVGLGFDYSDIDVTDKVVAISLETLPDSLLKKYDLNKSNTNEMESFELRKRLAVKHGAKGILFFHADDTQYNLYKSRHQMLSKLKRKASTKPLELNRFPIIFCKKEVGQRLFKLKKKKYVDFLKNPLSKGKTQYIKLNFIEGYNQSITENVIGILPGTTKKQEYIFVTAHYDHLGIMNGRIYNGADDNGSGTSALLALAETFMKAKNNGLLLEKNIVFIAFSGEELGLLGSEFLTNNLNIPHKSITAVYNIDMIGRASKTKTDKIELYIVGDKKCTTKNETIVNNHFSDIFLDYSYNSKNHPEKLYYRSDHYNFARFGVDFIFFTTGLHENYHLPSDDSFRIDYESLLRITQLIFMNIHTAATQN